MGLGEVGQGDVGMWSAMSLLVFYCGCGPLAVLHGGRGVFALLLRLSLHSQNTYHAWSFQYFSIWTVFNFSDCPQSLYPPVMSTFHGAFAKRCVSAIAFISMGGLCVL